MGSDFRLRRPTHMFQEHTLPGSLHAEGYRLNLAHAPGTIIATVHRNGQHLGHIELRNWEPVEEWKNGEPHRAGLREAVLSLMEGHARGKPPEDGWSHPLPGARLLHKAEPTAERPPASPGFHATPQGSHITTPHPHYSAAMAAKPKGQASGVRGHVDRNIWVRPHHALSNEGRTLMVQFSSDLLQGSRQRDHSDDYYDNLYSKRQGYHRPDDWWEVPQWQAHIAHSLPHTDHYTVRDPEEAAAFIRHAGYKNVCFSSLDVTAPFIRQLAAAAPDQKFVVGGYTDMSMYKDHPNVAVHPSVQSFVESEGHEYRPGYDYRHFHGVKVIPRLTLSDGCRHQCTFCCVPKKVVEKPMSEVEQQADAFGDHLDSELVYLNDKTFGQADNHAQLPALFQRIKAKNPNFQGFVIQTTAAQMRRFTPEFLRAAGIRHIELGIESVNDPILKAHKKPANEALIEEAAQKIRQAGSTLIPNIMVGLPGENKDTYGRTMDWLRKNRDIISHVNAYNLALYDDSELGKKLQSVSQADRDENQQIKSWMADPEVHRQFGRDLFAFANEQLDQPIGHVLAQPMAKGEVVQFRPRPSVRQENMGNASVHQLRPQAGPDVQAPQVSVAGVGAGKTHYDYSHLLDPASVNAGHRLVVKHAPGQYGDFMTARVFDGAGNDIAHASCYPHHAPDDDVQGPVRNALLNHSAWVMQQRDVGMAKAEGDWDEGDHPRDPETGEFIAVDPEHELPPTDAAIRSAIEEADAQCYTHDWDKALDSELASIPDLFEEGLLERTPDSVREYLETVAVDGKLLWPEDPHKQVDIMRRLGLPWLSVVKAVPVSAQPGPKAQAPLAKRVQQQAFKEHVRERLVTSAPEEVPHLSHVMKQYKLHASTHRAQLLQYAIHRMENVDRYDSVDGAKAADQEFERGQAKLAGWRAKDQKAKPPVPVYDLRFELAKKNAHIMDQLLAHRKSLHEELMKHAVTPPGTKEPCVVLSRSLSGTARHPDPLACSYSDSVSLVGGRAKNTWYHYVPIKNIWYGYNHGPIDAWNELCRTPEGEFVVSPHEHMLAKSEELHPLIPEQAWKWGPGRRAVATDYKEGAGLILVSRKTGRVLLPQRSGRVDEGGTWGTWGGGLRGNEDPRLAARREAREEMGYKGPVAMSPFMVYERPGLRFHNFIGVVDDEFEPKTNWETQGYRWVDPDPERWPKPLHSGLKAVLEKGLKAAIRAAIDAPLRKSDDELPTDVDPELAPLVKPRSLTHPVASGHAPTPDPENYQLFTSPAGFHVLTPDGNEQWFDSEAKRDAYLKWHQTLIDRPVGVRLLKYEDPHPKMASSILVHNENGDVLWGRRVQDGRWTLPGGHLEANEDPATAAVRELFEEAGVSPDSITHFGTANTPTGVPVFMFHAQVFDQQPHSGFDPDHEVAEWRWVNCLMGVPPEIRQNLAHPRNVVLEHMGW